MTEAIPPHAAQVREAYKTIINWAIQNSALTESERENMKDSPDRVTRAFLDMILPREEMLSSLAENLSKDFTVTSEEERQDSNFIPSFTPRLVVESPIRASSLCPHHFLPIMYDVMLCLKFNDTDKVVGLSKYVRISQLLARRAVVQEQYTKDLVTIFTRSVIGNMVPVESRVRVAGAMAIVSGVHGCMQCRGVRSDTITTSSYHEGMTEAEIATIWGQFNARK
jgi:GTP cyclohydrolase I